MIYFKFDFFPSILKVNVYISVRELWYIVKPWVQKKNDQASYKIYQKYPGIIHTLRLIDTFIHLCCFK